MTQIIQRLGNIFTVELLKIFRIVFSESHSVIVAIITVVNHICHHQDEQQTKDQDRRNAEFLLPAEYQDGHHQKSPDTDQRSRRLRGSGIFKKQEYEKQSGKTQSRIAQLFFIENLFDGNRHKQGGKGHKRKGMAGKCPNERIENHTSRLNQKKEQRKRHSQILSNFLFSGSILPVNQKDILEKQDDKDHAHKQYRRFVIIYVSNIVIRNAA